MYYNRKSEPCRTPRMNSVFVYPGELAGVLAKEKTGNPILENLIAGRVVVEPLGVEPRSKQVHCKLSTCLFAALDFGKKPEPDKPIPFLAP